MIGEREMKVNGRFWPRFGPNCPHFSVGSCARWRRCSASRSRVAPTGTVQARAAFGHAPPRSARSLHGSEPRGPFWRPAGPLLKRNRLDRIDRRWATQPRSTTPGTAV